MFPDLAHEISLQWSRARVTSQACPGSFETPGACHLDIEGSRVRHRPKPSIHRCIQTFAPRPCIDMGRGSLPSSAPLLAYLYSTTTQIVVQFGPPVPQNEKPSSRGRLNNLSRTRQRNDGTRYRQFWCRHRVCRAAMTEHVKIAERCHNLTEWGIKVCDLRPCSVCLSPTLRLRVVALISP